MKRFLIITSLFLAVHGTQGQSGKGQHYSLLVGTYTSPGKSEGIYIYDFDAATGDCVYKGKSPAIQNPSYLTLSKDEKYVYAVGETKPGTGSLNAFQFDRDRNELRFIDSVRTGGSPCYVSVNSSNSYAFAANYGGGSLFAVRIRPDGSLDSAGQLITHEGSSVHRDQTKPHVHSTVLSPDERYLLAADLGVDKIYVYRFDKNADTPLTEAVPPFAKTIPGSGPRHIVFHPNGKFAYVVNELDGSISAWAYNDGKLAFLQAVTMLQKGFTGTIEAADIHVSADGRFLYGTNREESNELLIYAIGKNGKLEYAGRQSTLGKGPRNFALDPTGKFLLVANGNSDEVVIFQRDPTTGLVTFTGKKFSLSRPVCLKFTMSAR